MDRIEKILNKEPDRKVRSILTILTLFFIVFVSKDVIGGYDPTKNDGMKVAVNIIRGILTPDKELLFDFSSQGVLHMLIETMAIALLGTIIGAILSLPLAFLASENITGKTVSYITKIVIMLIRTIPSLIYGLMFIRVTGPGPFAGVLTMSFTSIGMLTKLFSDTIEQIHKDILESLHALGHTTFRVIRFGIIPSLMANFISTVIYRFDINVRDAAILGIVGAGGIGSPLMFAMNSYKWNQVGSILIGLIVMVLTIEFISTKIRRKLVNG